MFRLVVFSCLSLAIYAYRQPTQQRIVGGVQIDITETPYQVSVQYEGDHTCGGAIIGPKHILTAAHCVEDKDHNSFSIRAGTKKHFKGGKKVNVEKIISHPSYDTDTVDYDAAVLILKEPLKLDEGVQVANLANVEPKEGDMVLISGWGAREKDNGLWNFLQSALVPVISKSLCKQKYEPDDKITDQMFCAGHTNGGVDSCEGDSGGPAMINNKLAGIVSWGEGCGDPKFPGVYTNLVKILPWIKDQIKK